MDCIEAPGSRDANGYARKCRNGKQEYAHRLAWMDAHGPIPPGMVVRHACDNPPCVNPEHLILGTQLDNIQDMHDRGRYRSGGHKLTVDQVHEARQRVQSGERQSAVARSLGIHQSTLSRIMTGDTWKGR